MYVTGLYIGWGSREESKVSWYFKFYIWTFQSRDGKRGLYLTPLPLDWILSSASVELRVSSLSFAVSHLKIVLKADRPHPRDYPQTPLITYNYLRLVMVSCCPFLHS